MMPQVAAPRSVIPSWNAIEDVLISLTADQVARAALRAPPVSEGPILIDAGRSEAGWSRIGSAFKCRQLYAWINVGGYSLIPADALTMGSMGHTAAAHWFALEGCRQGGVVVGTQLLGPEDASRLLDPEDAVRAWVAKEKRGGPLIDGIIGAFRRYVAKHPEPIGRILGVEVPVGAVLGTVETPRGPEWGLWLQDAPEWLLEGRRPPKLVETTTLDCPGHPRHGQSIRITRKLDLIWQSSWGDVFVYDHKFVSHVNRASAEHAYESDGGFRSQSILASQLLPARAGATDHGGPHSGFAGVFANLIGKFPPYKNEPVPIRRSAFREARFARNLFDVEHEVARLEMETQAGERDVSEWPAADEETTCIGRYAGGCSARRICLEGPGALDAGPSEFDGT